MVEMVPKTLMEGLIGWMDALSLRFPCDIVKEVES